jgi:hypothetical protein
MMADGSGFQQDGGAAGDVVLQRAHGIAREAPERAEPVAADL